jgi:hypothetical protein
VISTERSGAPVVVFLCPKVCGRRNVVHSRLLDRLRERGLRACLLTPASRAAVCGCYGI